MNLSDHLAPRRALGEAKNFSEVQFNHSHAVEPREREEPLDDSLPLAKPRFSCLVNWSGLKRKEMAHSDYNNLRRV